MFGYCAQLFRKSSGQDAVNAGMQVHFKSQQRALGSLGKALRVRLVVAFTVSDVLDVVLLQFRKPYFVINGYQSH